MQERRTSYGWALRVDPGEDLWESLRSFAEREGVRSGAIVGLGSLRECELGFFVGESGTYARRTFTGEFELVALTGNFSELEGRPFPHCHASVSGPDFAVFGGHLFRAVVGLTCEVQVVCGPDVLRRVVRPDLGFNPLDLA